MGAEVRLPLAATALAVLALNCSGCALTQSPPPLGPWITPVHAYGFISCTGNTPIAWLRMDVAVDPNVLPGLVAHETQHIIDIVSAGGCRPGLAAYYTNPLWYESRAYCAGFHELARRRLAPNVAAQIVEAAPRIATSLGRTTDTVAAALQYHCFTRLYTQTP